MKMIPHIPISNTITCNQLLVFLLLTTPSTRVLIYPIAPINIRKIKKIVSKVYVIVIIVILN